MNLRVVSDFSRTRQFFNRLRFAHTNYPALWKPAYAIYTSFVVEVFRAEGQPEKWAPLRPATLARRRRGTAGGNPKILRDTGILWKSAVTPTGGGYVKYQPMTMEVGTNLSYAGYHHYGTKHMVQRRFYQYDDPILARMAAAMNHQALKHARG